MNKGYKFTRQKNKADEKGEIKQNSVNKSITTTLRIAQLISITTISSIYAATQQSTRLTVALKKNVITKVSLFILQFLSQICHAFHFTDDGHLVSKSSLTVKNF